MSQHRQRSRPDLLSTHATVHDVADDFREAPVKAALQLLSFHRAYGEDATQVLEKPQVLTKLFPIAKMLITGTSPMDPEYAEFFGKVIPMGVEETTNPVLDIEELMELLKKWPDALHKRPMHHHETRFADDILLKPSLKPLRKKPSAILSSRREGCSFLAHQQPVPIRCLHAPNNMIDMRAGDKSDVLMFLENHT